jgi:hypothetical protein
MEANLESMTNSASVRSEPSLRSLEDSMPHAMGSDTPPTDSPELGLEISSTHPAAKVPERLDGEEQADDKGAVLRSSMRQMLFTFFLCFSTIVLSILVFLYVYAALVMIDPPLGPLLFSPSRTLLIVTILSQALAVFIRMSFFQAYEHVRWHLASRNTGVAMATFLGLSGGTSSLGRLKLLFGINRIGAHTIWCAQRYEQFFNGKVIY